MTRLMRISLGGRSGTRRSSPAREPRVPCWIRRLERGILSARSRRRFDVIVLGGRRGYRPTCPWLSEPTAVPVVINLGGLRGARRRGVPRRRSGLSLPESLWLGTGARSAVRGAEADRPEGKQGQRDDLADPRSAVDRPGSRLQAFRNSRVRRWARALGLSYPIGVRGPVVGYALASFTKRLSPSADTTVRIPERRRLVSEAMLPNP